MLYTVWAIGVVGLIKTVFLFHSYQALELALFLLMGWIVVIVGGPIYQHLPVGGLFYLVAGGVVYSSGVVFFRLDGRVPFAHAIWHVFVVVGAFIHMKGVFECLYS